MEQVVHTLEWVRIEEFVGSTWGGCGRPEHDRGMLSNAFVAKAALGLPATAGLIERLAVDRALRRIWDERLVGHISRDGTAIAAREKPAKQVGAAVGAPMKAPETTPVVAKKRGRPGKGEIRCAKPGKLEQQQGKPLAQLLKELPRDCGRGSKCNAQGYKNSWNGYRLHLDTADCGIPVSALLSSASMHDSLAAIPLSLMTAQQVTNCYDLMDAAYCSSVLREHSRNLGHVPLIDHNRVASGGMVGTAFGLCPPYPFLAYA